MAAPQRQRSDAFVFFLGLIFLGNLLGVFFYSIEATFDPPVLPMPGWAMILMALLAAANCASAWALWQWRRWGFFGFGAVALAGFVINLIVGEGYFNAFISFVAVAITYLLMRPCWEQFD